LKNAITNNFTAAFFALLCLAGFGLSASHAQDLQESPLAVQTLPVDELFSLIIRAEGDTDRPARITARQLPQDAVLLRNLDGSRTFMWIPQEQDIGETSIRITVTDANDPDISATYPIYFEISRDTPADVSKAAENAGDDIKDVSSQQTQTTAEAAAETTSESTAITSSNTGETEEAAAHPSQNEEVDALADSEATPATTITAEDPEEEALAEVDNESDAAVETSAIASAADAGSTTTTADPDTIATGIVSSEALSTDTSETITDAALLAETESVMSPENENNTQTATTDTQAEVTPAAEAEQEVTEDKTVGDVTSDVAASDTLETVAATANVVGNETQDSGVTEDNTVVDTDADANAEIIEDLAPQLSAPAGEIIAYVNRELTVALDHANESERAISVRGLNLPAAAILEPAASGHTLRWTPRTVDIGATAIILVAIDERNPASRTVRRLNITIRENP